MSYQNLIKESVSDSKIIVTGNTVIDALYWVVDKIKNQENLRTDLQKVLFNAGYDVDRLQEGRKLVLITGHRRENFGDGFINICKAIKTLGEKYSNVDFVYPMHLNPNVRKPIYNVFGDNLTLLSNLFFIEPLEYLSFVFLMEKACIVLTDSGGIQEEAPSLGKPVLVMRDTTERPEGVEAGTLRLTGTDEDVISKGIEDEVEKRLLQNAIDHLNPRERKIVELRFGLTRADGEEMTQKEVADLMGISQSYISRLEKKIMRRLKKEIVRFE